MPKVKTHKSAAKRFRVTGTGKVVKAKGYRRHNLSKKSSKRKRSLSGDGVLSKGDAKKVKRLIPYS